MTLPPTRLLFREDAYLRDAPARVIGHTPEGGILLDASVFYATSGGQPGDSGRLLWDGGQIAIATAVYNTQPFILVGLGALFFAERLTLTDLDDRTGGPARSG